MTRIIRLLAGVALVLIGLVTAVVWFGFRIYVPPGKCAVLIRKMGSALPPGQLVATDEGQKGIELEVLGPGRHFRDPYRYDWEFKDLTVVPAGNPSTWEWIHTISSRARERITGGNFHPQGDFPMIGVVTRRIGKPPPSGQLLVKRDSLYAGILEEVLTPGTYKLNPYVYEVELQPATVIPAGFVGVVTNLFGAPPKEQLGEILPELESEDSSATSQPSTTQYASYFRPLANPGERGTLQDVLQPGVYFINPKLQKVTLIEIGFNEFSTSSVPGERNFQISFPSDTGFLIRVGVSVVWGIDPRQAANIINQFGNTDGVIDKVIEPQLRSICRNIGSTYAARDFIQGEKREKFQRDLKDELQRVCSKKNIEVLLALVREIEVQPPDARGGETSEDLKRTIQESFIAKEKQITKEKQRAAATAKAQLEEFKKKVDIAREMIRSDTRIAVANIQADGEKKAAEVDAQAGLEVAAIQQQVAQLDAQRTQIMGQAKADVQKMKNTAEAEGFKLLVEAFGSAKAYNLYTFAENFHPESIKLIFAGEGTFWTDLSRLDELGAAKVLQSGAKPSKPAAQP
ncbi:MAG TPA: SPFH domain-containing protein [Phycisphaerae bacterium]|nr:SPFH domain-containing protein [Phycisphaerae bacterium]